VQASKRIIMKRGGQPRYSQLASILREQIQSGGFKPGDLLPTENAITKQFEVSLTTVREALRVLVAEGLISRQSGRGTFVAQRPARITYRAASTIEDLYTFGGDVEELASGEEHESVREFLGQTELPADTRIAERLGIRVGTPVFEFRYRISNDKSPLGYVASHVPADIGCHIPVDRLEQKPLVVLLSEVCGRRIVKVDQWTMASLANAEIAEILDIHPGDPILVLRRVFWEQDGSPVQTTLVTFRGDRFRQYVCLRSLNNSGNA
jgi:GntR family transcriptional regulator